MSNLVGKFDPWLSGRTGLAAEQDTVVFSPWKNTPSNVGESNMPNIAHLTDWIPRLALETANLDMPVTEPAAVAAQVLQAVLAAHTSLAFWLQQEDGVTDQ